MNECITWFVDVYPPPLLTTQRIYWAAHSVADPCAVRRNTIQHTTVQLSVNQEGVGIAGGEKDEVYV